MRRSWISLLAVSVVGCIVGITASADAAPKKPKKPAAEAPKDEATADFDRAAATSAIEQTDLSKCKATNAARGEGHVVITFGPAGTAQSATVDKGPWLGTPVAKCMVKAFKKTKVPAFKGDAVTVGKTFHFE